MIEIKCSKAQYKRIITAMSLCPLLGEEQVCVLGKNLNTCLALKNSDKPKFSCTECFEKNIKRIER